MGAKDILITSAKSLGHGIGFSFLANIGVLVWARIFGIYIGLNAWLSLIGVFALLAVGWGLINVVMMHVFWAPVDANWKSVLPQGLILFAIFFVIQILPFHFVDPFLVNLGYTAYLASFVVVNAFFSLVDGYIAMRVGMHWKTRGIPQQAEAYIGFTPEPAIQAANPRALHCPRCGGVNMVVAPDNSAYCIDCGRGIRRERLGGAGG
jgi:hypothetical protein